jgi:alpha-tubulin suppressor-like RCC1 family protein
MGDGVKTAIQKRSIPIILLATVLAGCGTLSVNVDFGNRTATGTMAASAGSHLPEPDGTELAQAPTPTGTASVTASATVTPTTAAVRAVDVALGRSHSCAVFEDGHVKCWGLNEHGQLGSGGMAGSSVPVEVAGLVDAKALTAGWAHTCALTRTGGVKCWGYGKYGELGNGGTSDSAAPVGVSGLTSGVIAIDAGDDHTCAVTALGEVKCWGYNRYGQLGDGTTTSRSVPVRVPGIAGGALAVAAGWGHTCILTADKSVRCWGNNEYGQLGYGEVEDYRFTHMDVPDLTMSAERISADGGQTCVLTIYGSIQCWGNNKHGQLGDGTMENRPVPVAVAVLAQDMRSVVAGWNHTCAVNRSGGVFCWGWNLHGQLGDGTNASRTTPAQVYALEEGVEAVSVGWAHSCAVTALGGVKCWGANDAGQLGDGTSLDSQVPQVVTGPGGSEASSASNSTTATVSPSLEPISPPTITRTPAPLTPTRDGVMMATVTPTKT